MPFKPLAEIHNLTKSFGSTSLFQNINLTLPEHELIGVVGPDGSGKTTLLRLLSGLLTPTQGSIKVLGFDTIQEIEKIRTSCGYMPQQFGLYEDLTALQNLELYAALKGLSAEEKEATFADLLHFTGLKPFTQRLAGALSGGMKQKLGLACALLTKPKVLILDEPSVGVDPLSRRELWKMVTALLGKNVSILWGTTYLDEAEKCEKVLLLDKGKILYFGPPALLTQRVAGRVFLIEDLSPQRRQHLAEWEKRDDVVDALLQGNHIRLVMKTPSLEGAIPTNARLEDAFVDILGGKIGGNSPIAAAAPPTTEGPEEAIEAIGLGKQFGTFTAVHPLTFSIKRGEIFGFLGPNGAGKSTTFKMLCGLLKPSVGDAIVNGFNLKHSPVEAAGRIGYMAQKFSLYRNLSVLQNLTFFSGIYKTQGKEQIKKMIDLFGLHDFLHETTDGLPLGYKQKMALAAATMHWPDLFFLDEPTSGMDPVARRQFWSHMNGLARKGKTIMVTTHFMDEAENCDRIALVYKGQIICLKSPFELKQSAITKTNSNPTLEDAFIQKIQEFDAK